MTSILLQKEPKNFQLQCLTIVLIDDKAEMTWMHPGLFSFPYLRFLKKQPYNFAQTWFFCERFVPYNEPLTNSKGNVSEEFELLLHQRLHAR